MGDSKKAFLGLGALPSAVINLLILFGAIIGRINLFAVGIHIV